MAGSVTIAPTSSSPPSHQDAGAAKETASRPPPLRPSSSSQVQQPLPTAGPSVAVPQRAPLPNRPKTGTTAKSAAPLQAGGASLPRISLPPVDKMAMAAVISPNPMPEPQPMLSMTSKEWVIPPRPKPGRKPATDTPPTKRKAQNRAAQRAFRERRAARVGELEEMMDEQKRLHGTEEQELRDKIHSLELDVQSFKSRCLLLENMLERERQERIRAETQAETLRLQQNREMLRSDSLGGSQFHSSSRNPLSQHPHQRHSTSNDHQSQQHRATRHFSISQIITPPETMGAHSPHELPDAPLTCGNCSPNGPCACAEEVLASAAAACNTCGFGTSCQCLDEAANSTGRNHDLKRPVSPSGQLSGEKRHRSDPNVSAVTEIDFTTMAQKPNEALQVSFSQLPSMDTMSFRDSCGFCKDGTYCVCADTAMATPAMTPTETPPPTFSRQTRTPPPSESDVFPPPLIMEMTAEGAVKLPRRKTARADTQSQATQEAPRGCGTSGPGTCAQCQADPKSGLFCRLMAANFDRKQVKPGGGCCGGKGAGGGCCKVSTKPEKVTLPSLPSLGLSCAEAYQTLASHRNFERAADEISSWLPKLKATTKEETKVTPIGRMPIEVEAASIMSVLKEFDVRFGRDC